MSTCQGMVSERAFIKVRFVNPKFRDAWLSREVLYGECLKEPTTPIDFTGFTLELCDSCVKRVPGYRG